MPFVMGKSKSENGTSVSNEFALSNVVLGDIYDLPFIWN